MADKHYSLQLENISASYDNKEVLHHITLELEQNSFLGIAGPNGGGKTTLIKVILGLLKPTEGKVSFFRNGEKVSHLHMGYLPQQNTFDNNFPISVQEAVLSGALGNHPFLHKYSHEEEMRCLKLLEKVELQKEAHSLISKLSGGQRQRALLARALMCQPEILILDEPNTFFDIKARSWMLRELKELQQSCAIIMVSHDMRDLFSVTDQIAYIHHHLHLYQTSEISITQLEEDILNSHCTNM